MEKLSPLKTYSSTNKINILVQIALLLSILNSKISIAYLLSCQVKAATRQRVSKHASVFQRLLYRERCTAFYLIEAAGAGQSMEERVSVCARQVQPHASVFQRLLYRKRCTAFA
jgi:hypothetical protein